MSYLVLARKYRPRTFEEVVGQESVAQTLRNAIRTGRVAHAYLFAGPRGVGKTTMARLLARAMNCARRDEPSVEPCGEEDRCEPCRLVLEGNDLDVIEIDGASNRGIDEIRRLRENVKFAPARSRYKIYVVDEVHMLTTEAFNALLKTLEEPPPHVKFLFATTAPQKVPETVRSRCQIFEFRRIRGEDIVRRLSFVAEAEGVTVPADLLDAIADSTRGGMRDAVSLLDQLLTLAGDRAPERSDLEELLGLLPTSSVREIVDRLAAGDAAGAVKAAAETAEAGIETEELVQQLLRHLRDVMLVDVCGAETDLVVATESGRAALAAQAGALPLERLVYFIRLLTATLRDVRLLGEGRILLEVSLVRLARSRDVRALEDLRADLDELVGRLGGTYPSGEALQPAVPAPNPPREKPSGLLPGAAALAEESVPTSGLVGRWPEVVEAVRREKPGVAAFLGQGRPEAAGEDGIRLVFGAESGFHRTQMELPENRGLLEGALRKLTGRRVRVEMATGEPESAAPGRAAAKERRDDLALKARDDPAVRRVCDAVRGRVVHVKRDDLPEEAP
jgi:DNA polymerase-3 subunit gamma/tau